MPTATPFKTIGRGNGFSTCPGKINVNDRGDGSPYFAYKVLTLADAMKLYWNLASVTATASAPADGGGTLVASLTSSDVFQQPNLRACGLSGNNFQDYDDDGFSSVLTFVSIPYIYRLYDGSTSNEANFLGYGIDTIASVRVDYLLSEFIDIIYTGLEAYDGGQSGESFTVTNVTVGNVTIFKLEALDNNQNISASISNVDFYTY
jgi:hypothetical protein